MTAVHAALCPTKRRVGVSTGRMNRGCCSKCSPQYTHGASSGGEEAASSTVFLALSDKSALAGHSHRTITESTFGHVCATFKHVFVLVPNDAESEALNKFRSALGEIIFSTFVFSAL